MELSFHTLAVAISSALINGATALSIYIYIRSTEAELGIESYEVESYRSDAQRLALSFAEWVGKWCAVNCVLAGCGVVGILSVSSLLSFFSSEFETRQLTLGDE